MIDTPVEELSEQQRKEMEEFEARLVELKAEQDKCVRGNHQSPATKTEP